MSDQDMKLPEGKTCGDCANYEDCKFCFSVRRATRFAIGRLVTLGSARPLQAI